jgi:hypothetical protein
MRKVSDKLKLSIPTLKKHYLDGEEKLLEMKEFEKSDIDRYVNIEEVKQDNLLSHLRQMYDLYGFDEVRITSPRSMRRDAEKRRRRAEEKEEIEKINRQLQGEEMLNADVPDDVLHPQDSPTSISERPTPSSQSGRSVQTPVGEEKKEIDVDNIPLELLTQGAIKNTTRIYVKGKKDELQNEIEKKQEVEKQIKLLNRTEILKEHRERREKEKEELDLKKETKASSMGISIWEMNLMEEEEEARKAVINRRKQMLIDEYEKEKEKKEGSKPSTPAQQVDEFKGSDDSEDRNGYINFFFSFLLVVLIDLLGMSSEKPLLFNDTAEEIFRKALLNYGIQMFVGNNDKDDFKEIRRKILEKEIEEEYNEDFDDETNLDFAVLGISPKKEYESIVGGTANPPSYANFPSLSLKSLIPTSVLNSESLLHSSTPRDRLAGQQLFKKKKEKEKEKVKKEKTIATMLEKQKQREKEIEMYNVNRNISVNDFEFADINDNSPLAVAQQSRILVRKELGLPPHIRLLRSAQRKAAAEEVKKMEQGIVKLTSSAEVDKTLDKAFSEEVTVSGDASLFESNGKLQSKFASSPIIYPPSKSGVAPSQISSESSSSSAAVGVTSTSPYNATYSSDVYAFSRSTTTPGTNSSFSQGPTYSSSFGTSNSSSFMINNIKLRGSNIKSPYQELQDEIEKKRREKEEERRKRRIDLSKSRRKKKIEDKAIAEELRTESDVETLVVEGDIKPSPSEPSSASSPDLSLAVPSSVLSSTVVEDGDIPQNIENSYSE